MTVDIAVPRVIADREEAGAPWTDRAIEAGVLFLLVFTPLAFGTVNPWSEAIAETVILAMVVLWVLGMVRQWELRVATPPGTLPAALFLLLGLLQMVPLPLWLTEILSPRAAALAEEVAAFTGTPADRVAVSLAPYATWQQWMKLLSVGLFFLVVHNTYRTRDQVRRLLWTMLLTAAFISLFGIIQRVTWNGRLYWIGPLAPHKGAFGPFVNPAHFAGLIVIVMPMGLAMMLGLRPERARRRLLRSWRDRLRVWNSRDVGAERLIPFLILLAGGAALASGSRGGVVSLLAALVAMASLGVRGEGRRGRGRVLATVIVLIVLVGAWVGGDVLYGTVGELVEELGAPSESLRLRLWHDATALVDGAPMIGTGLATFGVALETHRTVRAPVIFTHAESDWVQLVTDTGLLGMALVLLAIGTVSLSLLRQSRRGAGLWERGLGLGTLVALIGSVLQGIANYNLPVMANLLYLAASVAAALPLDEGP
jgi:O-antigen ligase